MEVEEVGLHASKPLLQQRETPDRIVPGDRQRHRRRAVQQRLDVRNHLPRPRVRFFLREDLVSQLHERNPGIVNVGSQQFPHPRLRLAHVRPAIPPVEDGELHVQAVIRRHCDELRQPRRIHR